ncbi:MAG TPA: thioredoxin family protein [Candidatus Limnocylindria bacterium]|nr:thioredoxin family protein [Candidatus Limnocylindria bacterium]
MTLDRARWDKGITYDAFKGAMTRNQERFAQNESRVTLDPETVRQFRSLPEGVRILVLAEDWCGDVVANLPVLGRLAQEVPTLDVRVFLRDQNLDLMERWLNQGKYQSIPVFVFLDRDFRELGHWIERPASVTERRAQERRKIFAAHPEFGSPEAPVDQLPEDVRTRLQAELQKMRDDMVPFANAEVQRELRELVSRVAV